MVVCKYTDIVSDVFYFCGSKGMRTCSCCSRPVHFKKPRVGSMQGARGCTRSPRVAEHPAAPQLPHRPPPQQMACAIYPLSAVEVGW
jgi:hypothetical protein